MNKLDGNPRAFEGDRENHQSYDGTKLACRDRSKGACCKRVVECISVKEPYCNVAEKSCCNGKEESCNDKDQIRYQTKDCKGECEYDLFEMLASQRNKKQYKEMFDYFSDASKREGLNDSFFVCDLASVLWQVQKWKETLPKVQPFYAVKANSDPVLLKFLVLLGVSFDCATEGEIRLVLDAGACPADIVFAHPFKTTNGLRFAKSVGLDLMTVDSDSEILRIRSIYPKARLLLRIKPLSVSGFFDFSNKYGYTLQEAKEALQKAKLLDMYIVGVSFHVGSLTATAKPFLDSILGASRIFTFASRIGVNFNIMDIGGGFFGEDGNNDLSDEITRKIPILLSDKFDKETVKFIGEPGCCFVRSAYTLVTTIIGKKEKADEKSVNKVKKHYYLNDGIYRSFNVYIEKYGIKMKPLLTETDILERPLCKSTLWGHSLCSKDTIREECFLPDMKIGESLIWENMGAYSRSICSTFCGTPIPTTQYVFVQNDRLNTKWIKNLDEIACFLDKVVVVVHCKNKVLKRCSDEPASECENAIPKSSL